MTTADTTGTRSRLPDPPEKIAGRHERLRLPRQERQRLPARPPAGPAGNHHRLGRALPGRRTRHAGRGPGLPRPAGRLQRRPQAGSRAYGDSYAYVIAEQGKPPDFVLEIASAATADNDTGHKRLWYAALGIAEYWRFDKTGEHHGTKLASDRLVEGRYEPAAIEEPEDGALQEYSEVLGLHVRWERGQLEWRNPATGQPIASLEAVERQIQEL